MACYNAQDYLEDAVNSALSQRDVTLEVLIIDDHSSDNSLALAQSLAEQDPRVRVLQTPSNAGPGGARNVGIEAMRGEWYCVLDCDDWLEPDRCRTLIDAAKALDADMIADDLMVFGGEEGEHRHLGMAPGEKPRPISLDAYFDGTRMFGDTPNLGFLKPMIRRERLIDQAHRYREDLRIGEDDELIIQLLLAGARYFAVSPALYRYRKHEASISHRLSLDHSERMMTSEEAVKRSVIAAGQYSPAYQARFASILDAVAFTRSVQALKQRDWAAAIRAVAERPSSARHYAMPIASRLKSIRARLGLA